MNALYGNQKVDLFCTESESVVGFSIRGVRSDKSNWESLNLFGDIFRVLRVVYRAQLKFYSVSNESTTTV